MRVAAIIVAAGKGERVGAPEPKQFIDLGEGQTMVDLTIGAFLATREISEIVVAVPPGYGDRLGKFASSNRVRAVEGGARRQDSMARAFAHVSPEADVVVVHDAARPYVSERLITETIDCAGKYGAAIAALPVHDTVKRTTPSSGQRTIVGTIPRDEVYLAQTPQAFRRDVLARAIEAAERVDATDEAMLCERLGIAVHVVSGDPNNVKVTTPEDMERLKQHTQERAQQQRSDVQSRGLRVGTGYDLHRLVAGRALILGGVRIPFEFGLDGHSDADIVCHAVTDAILGAAALGDIGRLFPDTDPTWKDADSVKLLRGAVEVVRQANYSICNVDVTIVAERPKLLPYIEQMRASLAAALGIDVNAVSIKGKTNEKVDAAGRGEAMACHAVALITQ